MKQTTRMKRTALAAGVLAACAVGAQAQTASSVSMYGVLDVGMSSFSRSATLDERLTKMNTDTNSSSIWGIRGTEDLGGGMAAQFGLEAALDPKNGNATGYAGSGANPPVAGVLFRRGSWVGLKGNFGSVQLGRNYTATILPQLVNGTAMPHTAVNSSNANIMAAQGIGNDFWNSNMIRYDSPNFSGVSFGLQYALGEVVGDSQAGTGFGGLLSYTTGPFKVAASYQKNNGTGIAAGKKVDYWILTGSYDVGQFRLAALYDQVKNDNNAIAGWADSKAWPVGGNYAFTPQLRVGAQYGELKDTIGNTKSKMALITAHYELSKRTYLFTSFGNANNGNVAVQPLWGGSQGAQQTVKNDSINGLALGVVHRF